MILSNSSDEPIYRQIVSQIKAQIMSGELERDGFIENFAGKGCFVKAQNTDFLREER